MMLAWCLIYLGIILLLGAAVTSLLLQRQQRSIPELIGLGLTLGAGICGMLLIWLSMLGLRPGRGTLLILGFIALIILITSALLRRLPSPALPRVERRPAELAAILPILLLLLANLSVLIPALGYSIFEWDAFSIWGLKAKVLYHSALTPQPDYFTDVRLSFSHLDYPLLAPMLTAGSYAMMGQVDDRLGKIVLPLILAGQTLLAYSAARLWLGRTASLLAATLLICMPLNLAFAGVGVADVTLATFWLGSLSYLIRWIQSNSRADVIIAALFALFTAMTKSEGLPLVLLSLAAMGIFAVRRRAWGDIICFALVPGIGIAIWMIWRAGIPRTDENYLGRLSWPIVAANLNRLGTILPALGKSFLRVERWGGLWLLLPLLAGLGHRAIRDPRTILLWAVLLSHLGLYILAYVISPWEDLGALIAASLERLLLHVAPVAMMLIAAHWAQISPRISPRSSSADPA